MSNQRLVNVLSSFCGAVGMVAVAATSADESPGPAADAAPVAAQEALVVDSASADNPFYSESPLDLHYPPFDRIVSSHYLPAFERGMAEELREIDALTRKRSAPTFDNTIVPLETSGALLDRVSRVFWAMTSAHSNDDLRKIEAQIAPRLSAHRDEILLNKALFARVAAVYEQRDEMGLDAESKRLVEETWKAFVRAGALLDDTRQSRLREINGELAELQTRFRQNVLAEVNELAIVVEDEAELAGLTPAQIQTAADEAVSRDMPGKFVIPLLNTTQQPLLSSLENRALRQRILETSMSRGHRGGEFDNREALAQAARLRAERAQLLGYDSHAAYVLDNQTAKTVSAVNERLAQLTPPAVANAAAEAADLQRMVDAEGGDFTVAAWDWDYYAEKVRADRYAFDAAQLRPYFELDSVLVNGVFYAAGRVFGLSFEERDDLPVYQEDVRVFEVFEENGETLGLFLFDPYARPSKRGGAWMNAYVSQSELLGTKPVVANHLNIPEPPAGEPTLLTFDEVTTAFHEFGHALHGLFSNVRYPSFSGTSVPRDFVEYPSQVNEMWATWPEVLANYARHYETGDPMPEALLDKVLAATRFNQGYSTTEYLKATLIDQALHQLPPEEVPSGADLMDFEAKVLEQAGASIATVPPRYRYPYFSHIIGGYSAGYYSYIWSEVLDADTVEWFRENGGLRRENGDHFRETLLSRGGSKEAMTLFREFRGREPDIKPLLERRGLDGSATGE
jgi:peptidyl-dipeptidase Dcp